jgi:uncharacterized membrane protein YdbT with pleckstrin-like domain
MSLIEPKSGNTTSGPVAAPRGIFGTSWFDRTIAAIACVPFVWFGYQRYRHGGLNLPLVILWIDWER